MVVEVLMLARYTFPKFYGPSLVPIHFSPWSLYYALTANFDRELENFSFQIFKPYLVRTLGSYILAKLQREALLSVDEQANS